MRGMALILHPSSKPDFSHELDQTLKELQCRQHQDSGFWRTYDVGIILCGGATSANTLAGLTPWETAHLMLMHNSMVDLEM